MTAKNKISTLGEPRPVSLTKHYRGSGKRAWKKLGGGENYLLKERESWKEAPI